MKKQETYSRCEQCDAMLPTDSPPSKATYNSARIEIRNGTILLPARVVEANGNDSHAADLSGVYCDKDCLYDRIRAILAPGKRGGKEKGT